MDGRPSPDTDAYATFDPKVLLLLPLLPPPLPVSLVTAGVPVKCCNCAPDQSHGADQMNRYFCSLAPAAHGRRRSFSPPCHPPPTQPDTHPTPHAAPFPPLQAPAGRAQRPAGPFKEALVFMLGGGNYLEYESLRCGLGHTCMGIPAMLAQS